MTISINSNPNAEAAPSVGVPVPATVTMVEINRTPNKDFATGKATNGSSPLVQLRFRAENGWIGVQTLAGFQDGNRPDKRRFGAKHMNEAIMLVDLMVAANADLATQEEAANLSDHPENQAIRNILHLPVIATVLDDEIPVKLDDGSEGVATDISVVHNPDAQTESEAPAAQTESEEEIDI